MQNSEVDARKPPNSLGDLRTFDEITLSSDVVFRAGLNDPSTKKNIKFLWNMIYIKI